MLEKIQFGIDCKINISENEVKKRRKELLSFILNEVKNIYNDSIHVTIRIECPMLRNHPSRSIVTKMFNGKEAPHKLFPSMKVSKPPLFLKLELKPSPDFNLVKQTISAKKSINIPVLKLNEASKEIDRIQTLLTRN